MTEAPQQDLTILLLDPEQGEYPSDQDPDFLYSGALLDDELKALEMGIGVGS